MFANGFNVSRKAAWQTASPEYAKLQGMEGKQVKVTEDGREFTGEFEGFFWEQEVIFVDGYELSINEIEKVEVIG